MRLANSPHSHVTANRPQPLSWSEAIQILEATDAKGVPIPFAIAFCTADEERRTGGEIVRYERAVWHLEGGKLTRKAQLERAGATGSGREPSEKDRWYRKVRAVDSDQVRRVFVHLILSINHRPVR